MRAHTSKHKRSCLLVCTRMCVCVSVCMYVCVCVCVRARLSIHCNTTDISSGAQDWLAQLKKKDSRHILVACDGTRFTHPVTLVGTHPVT